MGVGLALVSGCVVASSSCLAAPWAPSIVVLLVASTCQNGIGRRNCKHAIGEARTVRRVSWGCIGIASMLIVRALKAVPQAVM